MPGEGFESLLSSDYSQVELRIMADLSGDEALIEAFRSGKDFHKYVASLVYGIPVDDITSSRRSAMDLPSVSARMDLPSSSRSSPKKPNR